MDHTGPIPLYIRRPWGELVWTKWAERSLELCQARARAHEALARRLGAFRIRKWGE